jgi:hypothetical protein
VTKEAQIQKAIDDQIFALYQVSSGTQAKVMSDPWVRGKSGEFARIAGKI